MSIKMRCLKCVFPGCGVRVQTEALGLFLPRLAYIFVGYKATQGRELAGVFVGVNEQVEVYPKLLCIS